MGLDTENLGPALGSGRFTTSQILPTQGALGARGEGNASAGVSEKHRELVEWRVSLGRGAAGLRLSGGNSRHISFPGSGLQPLSSFGWAPFSKALSHF